MLRPDLHTNGNECTYLFISVASMVLATASMTAPQTSGLRRLPFQMPEKTSPALLTCQVLLAYAPSFFSEGVNDIGHATDPEKPYDFVSADELIQGLSQLILRAHANS